ncbi:MAG: EthD family reductase [Vulcanimicrobiaceae bacterium]
MLVVTVGYKWGLALDFNYYAGAHTTLVHSNFGALGMRRFEVRKILATADGSTPPYQLIASLYFDDAKTFEAAVADQRGQAVLADIANFYPETPDVLVGEIWE